MLILAALHAFATPPLAPVPARAQDRSTPAAPPRTRPTGETKLLDLAAMTLIPADLTPPGFVLDTDGMVTLAEAADRANRVRRGAVDRRRLAAELHAAGWQRRYRSRLGLPSGNDPTRFTQSVTTSVTEYADATGAAKGFAILQDKSAIPTAHAVPGTHAVGDRLALTRDSGTTSDGIPFQELAISFQLGNLTAGVTVDDDTNRPPAVATVEALAAKLQARITTARDRGDGLGSEILRLAAPGPSSNLDGYVRRDGTTIRLSTESAARFSARVASYDGATDVYDAQQAIPGDPSPSPPAPFAIVRLYRFPSAATASTWLRAAPRALGADASQYVDVVPIAGTRTVGDESVALSYGYHAGETVTTRGVMVIARVGRDVARVQIDAWPSVPAAAVVAVATAQVACLHAGVCPHTAPLPVGLVPSAAASPAAAPIPSD